MTSLGLDHAEVAVARLAGMHVIGGRAGRGEGRGDLAADVAGLAHAGHDDPAVRGCDQIDRRRERLAEAVTDGLHENGQSVALARKRSQGCGDACARGVIRLGAGQGHARPLA